MRVARDDAGASRPERKLANAIIAAYDGERAENRAQAEAEWRATCGLCRPPSSPSYWLLE